MRGLILAMMQHNLTDDDVLLVHTGCQFPCNQAPVISVQPDDVWYGRVDADAADAIVTEHLVDRPGAPTRQALDLVLDHLRRRLLDGSAA